MMMIHRVPTSPSAWIPRNQRSSQKKTITTGSTILSPKYIWLKPIPRRHLLSIPNRVPIRSQSSSWGSLVVGSSTRGHVALGSAGGRGRVRLPSTCGGKVQEWRPFQTSTTSPSVMCRAASPFMLHVKWLCSIVLCFKADDADSPPYPSSHIEVWKSPTLYLLRNLDMSWMKDN